MGVLFYGSGRLPIPIDDRVLAHLKPVITNKLRRGEGLLVSWAEAGIGRNSIWIHPHSDLHYKFDGSRPALIERRLLEEMGIHSMDLHGIDLSDNRYSLNYYKDDQPI